MTLQQNNDWYKINSTWAGRSKSPAVFSKSRVVPPAATKELKRKASRETLNQPSLTAVKSQAEMLHQSPAKTMAAQMRL